MVRTSDQLPVTSFQLSALWRPETGNRKLETDNFRNMKTDFVTAGGLTYLSAMGPRPGSGNDIAGQTRGVLERARATLDASGSSLEQVVAVMVYLRSAADFQAMNAVYGTFWPADPPTRTTIVTELAPPGQLVQMSMVAVPAGAERTILHPAGWARSPSPYSYAIKSADTVFLSGLVSRSGRDNAVVAGDVRVQTKVIMDLAGEIFEAAGLTHANIVSARIYLPETVSFQPMNEAYRAYFPTAPPARATVQAALAGPQYDVEITLVGSSSAREVISDGSPPNPNLSTGVRAGRRVYLSGALGNTPATQGDVAAQTRETLTRLDRALAAAGCSPADVVDALVYVTRLETVPEVQREYRAFFGVHAPACTTVRSGLMAHDGLVEIMLTAVSP
jgi:2-iminobutanoate/2-iminopropanoate deaminase